jgi:hypothetical protein
MKLHRLFPILLIAFAVSPAFSQNREARNVGNFTSIHYAIPGKLMLRQGSPQKVEISGDKDVLQEIKTEVEGTRLVVGVKSKWNNWNFKDDGNIIVYITVPNLEALKVSGSGDVIGETAFNTGNFDLDISGSGDVKVTVQSSSEIDVNISGSGELDMTGKCRSFSSRVSGSGDMDLDMAVGDLAEFQISGSGDVKAVGSANEFKTSISGSSRISAEDFQTNRADIRISGSGDISIAVKDELDAHVSGSGNIRYKGNPSKVNSHASGSGKVSKL